MGLPNLVWAINGSIAKERKGCVVRASVSVIHLQWCDKNLLEMKVVSCLVGACVFITILCTVGAEEVAPGSVVDLNAETFSETSKGDWFVMFHAPW